MARHWPFHVTTRQELTVPQLLFHAAALREIDDALSRLQKIERLSFHANKTLQQAKVAIDKMKKAMTVDLVHRSKAGVPIDQILRACCQNPPLTKVECADIISRFGGDDTCWPGFHISAAANVAHLNSFRQSAE